MLATVRFERLDLFRTARDHTGKRQYLKIMLSKRDLDRVRICVLHGLGMGSLTTTLE